MKKLLASVNECGRVRTRLAVDKDISLEVVVITGRREGKTLLVSAGVHGGEYASIEAARRFAGRIDPEALSGRIIIFPLLNEGAFFKGIKQLMPEDEKNLNRAFPGKADGSRTERIAHFLYTEVFPEVSFVLDLHGGDLNEELTPLLFFPDKADSIVRNESLQVATSLTLPLLVASSAANGLYSSAAMSGTPALLLERGCLGRWSDTEVEYYVEDLTRALQALNMLEGLPQQKAQKLVTDAVYEDAECRCFWYPLVKSLEEVKKGQLLGHLKDWNGDVIRTIEAHHDGVVLYYTVALGVEAGTPLIAYGAIS